MEELIRRAEEKGIDVEGLLISALSNKDPQNEIKLRLELAEKYMKSAEEYLKQGDPVQASEKAYKVAEEVVKALAEKFDLPEYQQAIKEGRWYTYLLAKASNALAIKLGKWALDGWDSGYVIHVWGFHEAKLTVDDITSYVERVREMLEESKKIL
ncbi:superfamily I DNA and RNA helicase and helicase subunit [Sulfolobales archaeon HS-7]|nr:superfamily I DNA and RNA helicase and helicase subunit [Sulfolobales archaeon HS-7]